MNGMWLLDKLNPQRFTAAGRLRNMQRTTKEHPTMIETLSRVAAWSPRRLAALALVAAGASLWLGAIGGQHDALAASATFDPSQKAQIEAIIKDYLLNNPEVLRDALDVLEKRQSAEEVTKQKVVIASNAKLIFESPRGPSFGNPKGDVTLVEFFDYNCGYCKHAMGDVMRLAKDDPNLKVVFKELPVLGPGSLEAAKVAVAVRMQDKNSKYVEFHRRRASCRPGRRGRAGQRQGCP